MQPQALRQLLASLNEHPALAMLRLAVLADHTHGLPDGETLEAMRAPVRDGNLADLPPHLAWGELEAGLMGPAPDAMLRVLRSCGALQVLLPEVDALFGVAQSADEPAVVDIGEHLLASLERAARGDAPLAVRLAILLMNVGKADSPREHLPSHYRHMDRARPRIMAIHARFGLSEALRDFCLLALAECERVHRAAEARAGSVAALLERVGAFAQPARFDDLLAVCRHDFHAYPGRATQPYRKETLLRIALRACLEVDAVALAGEYGVEVGSDDEDFVTALLEARAGAVARSLRSQRWGVDGAGDESGDAGDEASGTALPAA